MSFIRVLNDGTVLFKGDVTTISYRDGDPSWQAIKLNGTGKIGIVTGEQRLDGAFVDLKGKLIIHPKYGEQVSVEAITINRDKLVLIEMFLNRAKIRYVTPAISKRMITLWGKETLEHIKKEELLAIKGIGVHKAKIIEEDWYSYANKAELYLEGMELGLSPDLLEKAIDYFGEDAVNVIKNNPYEIVRIKNVNWHFVERLAQDIGFTNKLHPGRVILGTWHSIRKWLQNGDTWVSVKKAWQLSQPTLQITYNQWIETIAEAINDDLFEKSLILIKEEEKTIGFTTRGIGNAETELAKAIAERLKTENKLGVINGTLTESSLTEEQKKAVVMPFSKAFSVMSGDPGRGKALRNDAGVLTPLGWQAISSLEPGNLVYAYNGDIVPVLGVYPQGELDIWEVEFVDGRITECSGDHLWTVKHKKYHATKDENGKRIKKGTKMQWETLTTEELFNLSKRQKQGLSVPMVKNVMERKVWLPIHPYVMGIIIAEGGLTTRGVTITNCDSFVIDKVRNLLPKGYALKKRRECAWGIVSTEYRAGTNDIHQLLYTLRTFGLMGKKSENKFIPQIYLMAGYEQRLELLNGLMDGDGYIGKNGGKSYSTSSKQLANDFRQLIWSLGGQAKMSERITQYTHKGKKRKGLTSYRINIKHGSGRSIVSLPRKKYRMREKEQYDWERLGIKSIRKTLRKTGMTCITIDHPSRLFVTDDYIVTHNSHSLREIVRQANNADIKIFLVAPTGKAAKRMQEIAGHEAETVHKLTYEMRKDGDGTLFAGSSYERSIFIVDEASMLDIFIGARFMSAVPNDSNVMFVGDPFQLPSVSPGSVLRDVIMEVHKNHPDRYVKLTKNFRQQEDSLIITNALALKHGKGSYKIGDSFQLFKADNYKNAARKAARMLDNYDVCITFFRKDRDIINSIRQEQNQEEAVKIGNKVFKVGDPVIQTTNNREINFFNGETGKIIFAWTDETGSELVIQTYDGREIELTNPFDINDIELAYAITTHKCQGSEYDKVLVFPRFHEKKYVNDVFLTRSLFYTAITRAKEKIGIVYYQPRIGQHFFTARAYATRNTRLQQLLNQAY